MYTCPFPFPAAPSLRAHVFPKTVVKTLSSSVLPPVTFQAPNHCGNGGQSYLKKKKKPLAF